MEQKSANSLAHDLVVEVRARVLYSARLRPRPQVREVLALGLELGPETVAFQRDCGAVAASLEVVADSYRNLYFFVFLNVLALRAIFLRLARLARRKAPRPRDFVLRALYAELALQEGRPAEEACYADGLARFCVEEPHEPV